MIYLWMICISKMLIFHSYVKLPVGRTNKWQLQKMDLACTVGPLVYLNLDRLSWAYPSMFSDRIMASWYFEVTHPFFWCFFFFDFSWWNIVRQKGDLTIIGTDDGNFMSALSWMGAPVLPLVIYQRLRGKNRSATSPLGEIVGNRWCPGAQVGEFVGEPVCMV